MVDNIYDEIFKGMVDVTSLLAKATLPMKICSNFFNKNILRMAGVSNPKHNDPGFGSVNVQVDMDDIKRNPWEIFFLRPNNDGSISIESAAFPHNYLRMEGQKSSAFSADGFGTVSCQADIGPYEKFKFNFLEKNNDRDVFSIESCAFPGNYLRLAGQMNPRILHDGFGKVNCQATVSDYEKFYFEPVSPAKLGS